VSHLPEPDRIVPGPESRPKKSPVYRRNLHPTGAYILSPRKKKPAPTPLEDLPYLKGDRAFTHAVPSEESMDAGRRCPHKRADGGNLGGCAEHSPDGSYSESYVDHLVWMIADRKKRTGR
jgi:hypothetical protein